MLLDLHSALSVCEQIRRLIFLTPMIFEAFDYELPTPHIYHTRSFVIWSLVLISSFVNGMYEVVPYSILNEGNEAI